MAKNWGNAASQLVSDTVDVITIEKLSSYNTINPQIPFINPEELRPAIDGIVDGKKDGSISQAELNKFAEDFRPDIKNDADKVLAYSARYSFLVLQQEVAAGQLETKARAAKSLTDAEQARTLAQKLRTSAKVLTGILNKIETGLLNDNGEMVQQGLQKLKNLDPTKL